MKRLTDRRQLATAAFAGIALLFQPESAFAQQSKESSALEDQLKRLETELHAQRQLIEEQTQRIGAQQAEIDALKTALQLRDIRGTGFAQTQVTPPPGTVALPGAPVGQAPAKPPVDQRAEVQAIPRDLGVLTPKGHLVFDPSVEYTRTSSNRLVFRGIELIPGIQIGLIEATDADRDAIMGNASLRYGITNRLEVEASLPYIYRNDKIEVVQQRDEQIVRNINLKGHGIGDAELNIRYQLNRVRPLKPIWIAGLRIKSATGEGPFEIPFDDFGVATGLATGSGFWGIEPGISFLLPSDPVVIYGGLSYFWHMAKDIDREVGDVFIGRVDPGDAITANIGFGFALNPRFSFSLGYRHNYILRTRTEIGDTTQRSDQLHIGQLNFGMSYRLTSKYTMNLGFEFGVTEEAPDVSITLRTPIELINPN